MAAEEGRYLAGSFLAMANLGGKKTEHDARVFLVIEARDEKTALDAAAGLLMSPKAIVNLLATLRPWPDETVVIDHEYLDKHMRVHSATKVDE